MRECVLHRVGDEKKFAAFWLQHSLADAVIEENEQFVIEASNVEQKDGLGVDVEGVPGVLAVKGVVIVTTKTQQA